MVFTKHWRFSKSISSPPPQPRKLKIPNLPSEIIECIILHVTHTPTLKACSVVSSTFHPAAEKLLLSAISIRLTKSDDNPYHAFLKLITTSAQHIPSLVVSLNLSDFYMQDSTSTWLAYDHHTLPRILALLPNIAYLGIHAHNNVSSAIRWALATHTLTPHLRSFSARGLSLDLRDVFGRCHSLHDARMADIAMISPEFDGSCDEEQDITEFLKPAHRSSPRIPHHHALIRQYSLQLTPFTSPQFIDQLLHASVWGSFAHLDTLELDLVHFPHPTAVQRLLAATSRCITDLRIRAYHTSSLGFHIHPTVPRVTYRFHVLPRAGNPSFVDMFQPFNRLHRQRTGSGTSGFKSHPPNRWRGISDLRLELELCDTFSLFEREDWEWAWLDEVLGAVRRKVTFVIYIGIPGEVEEGLKADMEGRIRQCLPRVARSGVLKVVVQLRTLC
ncbi:hypothetical protein CPB85DRAFT_99525 [Mucidula mucida]|nr:hypothetical protein CPB85DRAFT_99525 [Mucidula mucida]